MAGPLAGLRVIEMPAIGPVPLAGMMLADLGAEVIRIDRLGSGGGLGDISTKTALGRGRRSIGLDVRRPGGAEVALRLAERCDALIEGFRPGVAERLGVGPDEVLARNPKLVYGRMTGWGQHGPLAATAGHDLTYLAITGLLHGIGPAAGPPVPPINYVADFGGGTMFLVSGVLAALLHARETGEGQVVDTAMTEGAAYLGTMTRTFAGLGMWQDEREANLLDGGSPNYRCYADRRRQVARGRGAGAAVLEGARRGAGRGRRVDAVAVRSAAARRLPGLAGRAAGHPHPRRVGGAVRAARRLRGAGADPGRGARAPPQRRARHLHPGRRDHGAGPRAAVLAHAGRGRRGCPRSAGTPPPSWVSSATARTSSTSCAGRASSPDRPGRRQSRPSSLIIESTRAASRLNSPTCTSVRASRARTPAAVRRSRTAR